MEEKKGNMPYMKSNHFIFSSTDKSTKPKKHNMAQLSNSVNFEYSKTGEISKSTEYVQFAPGEETETVLTQTIQEVKNIYQFIYERQFLKVSKVNAQSNLVDFEVQVPSKSVLQIFFKAGIKEEECTEFCAFVIESLTSLVMSQGETKPMMMSDIQRKSTEYTYNVDPRYVDMINKVNKFSIIKAGDENLPTKELALNTIRVQRSSLQRIMQLSQNPWLEILNYLSINIIETVFYETEAASKKKKKQTQQIEEEVQIEIDPSSERMLEFQNLYMVCHYNRKPVTNVPLCKFSLKKIIQMMGLQWFEVLEYISIVILVFTYEEQRRRTLIQKQFSLRSHLIEKYARIQDEEEDDMNLSKKKFPLDVPTAEKLPRTNFENWEILMSSTLNELKLAKEKHSKVLKMQGKVVKKQVEVPVQQEEEEEEEVLVSSTHSKQTGQKFKIHTTKAKVPAAEEVVETKVIEEKKKVSLLQKAQPIDNLMPQAGPQQIKPTEVNTQDEEEQPEEKEIQPEREDNENILPRPKPAKNKEKEIQPEREDNENILKPAKKKEMAKIGTIQTADEITFECDMNESVEPDEFEEVEDKDGKIRLVNKKYMKKIFEWQEVDDQFGQKCQIKRINTSMKENLKSRGTTIIIQRDESEVDMEDENGQVKKVKMYLINDKTAVQDTPGGWYEYVNIDGETVRVRPVQKRKIEDNSVKEQLSMEKKIDVPVVPVDIKVEVPVEGKIEVPVESVEKIKTGESIDKKVEVPVETATEVPVKPKTEEMITTLKPKSEEKTTSMKPEMEDKTITTVKPKTEDKKSKIVEKTTTVPKIEEKTTIVPKIEEKTTTVTKIEEKTTTVPKIEEKTTTVPKTEEKTTTVPKIEEKTTTVPKTEEKTTTVPTKTVPKIEEKTTTVPKTEEKTTTVPKIEEKTTTVPTKTVPKIEEKTTTVPKIEEKTTTVPTKTVPKIEEKTTTVPKIEEKTTTVPKIEEPVTHIEIKKEEAIPKEPKKELTVISNEVVEESSSFPSQPNEPEEDSFIEVVNKKDGKKYLVKKTTVIVSKQFKKPSVEIKTREGKTIEINPEVYDEKDENSQWAEVNDASGEKILIKKPLMQAYLKKIAKNEPLNEEETIVDYTGRKRILKPKVIAMRKLVISQGKELEKDDDESFIEVTNNKDGRKYLVKKININKGKSLGRDRIEVSDKDGKTIEIEASKVNESDEAVQWEEVVDDKGEKVYIKKISMRGIVSKISQDENVGDKPEEVEDFSGRKRTIRPKIMLAKKVIYKTVEEPYDPLVEVQAGDRIILVRKSMIKNISKNTPASAKSVDIVDFEGQQHSVSPNIILEATSKKEINEVKDINGETILLNKESLDPIMKAVANHEVLPENMEIIDLFGMKRTIKPHVMYSKLISMTPLVQEMNDDENLYVQVTNENDGKKHLIKRPLIKEIKSTKLKDQNYLEVKDIDGNTITIIPRKIDETDDTLNYMAVDDKKGAKVFIKYEKLKQIIDKVAQGEPIADNEELTDYKGVKRVIQPKIILNKRITEGHSEPVIEVKDSKGKQYLVKMSVIKNLKTQIPIGGDDTQPVEISDMEGNKFMMTMSEVNDIPEANEKNQICEVEDIKGKKILLRKLQLKPLLSKIINKEDLPDSQEVTDIIGVNRTLKPSLIYSSLVDMTPLAEEVNSNDNTLIEVTNIKNGKKSFIRKRALQAIQNQNQNLPIETQDIDGKSITISPTKIDTENPDNELMETTDARGAKIIVKKPLMKNILNKIIRQEPYEDQIQVEDHSGKIVKISPQVLLRKKTFEESEPLILVSGSNGRKFLVKKSVIKKLKKKINEEQLPLVEMTDIEGNKFSVPSIEVSGIKEEESELCELEDSNNEKVLLPKIALQPLIRKIVNSEPLPEEQEVTDQFGFKRTLKPRIVFSRLLAITPMSESLQDEDSSMIEVINTKDGTKHLVKKLMLRSIKKEKPMKDDIEMKDIDGTPITIIPREVDESNLDKEWIEVNDSKGAKIIIPKQYLLNHLKSLSRQEPLNEKETVTDFKGTKRIIQPKRILTRHIGGAVDNPPEPLMEITDITTGKKCFVKKVMIQKIKRDAPGVKNVEITDIDGNKLVADMEEIREDNTRKEIVEVEDESGWKILVHKMVIMPLIMKVAKAEALPETEEVIDITGKKRVVKPHAIYSKLASLTPVAEAFDNPENTLIEVTNINDGKKHLIKKTMLPPRTIQNAKVKDINGNDIVINSSNVDPSEENQWIEMKDEKDMPIIIKKAVVKVIIRKISRQEPIEESTEVTDYSGEKKIIRPKIIHRVEYSKSQPNVRLYNVANEADSTYSTVTNLNTGKQHLVKKSSIKPVVDYYKDKDKVIIKDKDGVKVNASVEELKLADAPESEENDWVELLDEKGEKIVIKKKVITSTVNRFLNNEVVDDQEEVTEWSGKKRKIHPKVVIIKKLITPTGVVLNDERLADDDTTFIEMDDLKSGKKVLIRKQIIKLYQKSHPSGIADKTANLEDMDNNLVTVDSSQVKNSSELDEWIDIPDHQGNSTIIRKPLLRSILIRNHPEDTEVVDYFHKKKILSPKVITAKNEEIRVEGHGDIIYNDDKTFLEIPNATVKKTNLISKSLIKKLAPTLRKENVSCDEILEVPDEKGELTDVLSSKVKEAYATKLDDEKSQWIEVEDVRDERIIVPKTMVRKLVSDYYNKVQLPSEMEVEDYTGGRRVIIPNAILAKTAKIIDDDGKEVDVLGDSKRLIVEAPNMKALVRLVIIKAMIRLHRKKNKNEVIEIPDINGKAMKVTIAELQKSENTSEDRQLIEVEDIERKKVIIPKRIVKEFHGQAVNKQPLQEEVHVFDAKSGERRSIKPRSVLTQKIKYTNLSKQVPNEILSSKEKTYVEIKNSEDNLTYLTSKKAIEEIKENLAQEQPEDRVKSPFMKITEKDGKEITARKNDISSYKENDESKEWFAVMDNKGANVILRKPIVRNYISDFIANDKKIPDTQQEFFEAKGKQRMIKPNMIASKLIFDNQTFDDKLLEKVINVEEKQIQEDDEAKVKLQEEQAKRKVLAYQKEHSGAQSKINDELFQITDVKGNKFFVSKASYDNPNKVTKGGYVEVTASDNKPRIISANVLKDMFEDENNFYECLDENNKKRFVNKILLKSPPVITRTGNEYFQEFEIEETKNQKTKIKVPIDISEDYEACVDESNKKIFVKTSQLKFNPGEDFAVIKDKDGKEIKVKRLAKEASFENIYEIVRDKEDKERYVQKKQVITLVNQNKDKTEDKSNIFVFGNKSSDDETIWLNAVDHDGKKCVVERATTRPHVNFSEEYENVMDNHGMIKLAKKSSLTTNQEWHQLQAFDMKSPSESTSLVKSIPHSVWINKYKDVVDINGKIRYIHAEDIQRPKIIQKDKSFFYEFKDFNNETVLVKNIDLNVNKSDKESLLNPEDNTTFEEVIDHNGKSKFIKRSEIINSTADKHNDWEEVEDMSKVRRLVQKKELVDANKINTIIAKLPHISQWYEIDDEGVKRVVGRLKSNFISKYKIPSSSIFMEAYDETGNKYYIRKNSCNRTSLKCIKYGQPWYEVEGHKDGKSVIVSVKPSKKYDDMVQAFDEQNIEHFLNVNQLPKLTTLPSNSQAEEWYEYKDKGKVKKLRVILEERQIPGIAPYLQSHDDEWYEVNDVDGIKRIVNRKGSVKLKPSGEMILGDEIEECHDQYARTVSVPTKMFKSASQIFMTAKGEKTFHDSDWEKVKLDDCDCFFCRLTKVGRPLKIPIKSQVQDMDEDIPSLKRNSKIISRVIRKCDKAEKLPIAVAGEEIEEIIQQVEDDGFVYSYQLVRPAKVELSLEFSIKGNSITGISESREPEGSLTQLVKIPEPISFMDENMNIVQDGAVLLERTKDSEGPAQVVKPLKMTDAGYAFVEGDVNKEDEDMFLKSKPKIRETVIPKKKIYKLLIKPLKFFMQKVIEKKEYDDQEVTTISPSDSDQKNLLSEYLKPTESETEDEKRFMQKGSQISNISKISDIGGSGISGISSSQISQNEEIKVKVMNDYFTYYYNLATPEILMKTRYGIGSITSEIRMVEDTFNDTVHMNYITAPWEKIPLKGGFDFNTTKCVAYLKNIGKAITLRRKVESVTKEQPFSYLDLIKFRHPLKK